MFRRCAPRFCPPPPVCRPAYRGPMRRGPTWCGPRVTPATRCPTVTTCYTNYGPPCYRRPVYYAPPYSTYCPPRIYTTAPPCNPLAVAIGTIGALCLFGALKTL